MIRYAMICANAHEYESWFASSDSFDSQSAHGLLECPVCGAIEVRKAPMAPAIARRDREPPVDRKSVALAMGEAMRRHVLEHFDDVGADFAEEARRIHYGESDERPIHGAASPDEVRALLDEGVHVAPLPPSVEDLAKARAKQVN